MQIPNHNKTINTRFAKNEFAGLYFYETLK